MWYRECITHKHKLTVSTDPQSSTNLYARRSAMTKIALSEPYASVVRMLVGNDER